jgi:predicted transcriptional regulator
MDETRFIECLLEQLVEIDVCEKNQNGKYGLTSDGHLVFVTILLERMFDDKLTNDELVNRLVENGVIELKDNNMFSVTKKGIENVLLYLMWNFDNKNALEYVKKYKQYINRFIES